ncbi:MAG TPA: hypothetical protein VK539_03125 [Myxococcaceae bacterium]|nr:hypothetical protein [Myxococcaceae bacterium]
MFLFADPAALFAALRATTNKVSTAVRGLFRAPQPRMTKPTTPPAQVVQLGGAAKPPPSGFRNQLGLNHGSTPAAQPSGPVASMLQLLAPALEPTFTTMPVRVAEPEPVFSNLPVREPEPLPKPAPTPVRIAEQKPPQSPIALFQQSREPFESFSPYSAKAEDF